MKASKVKGDEENGLSLDTDVSLIKYYYSILDWCALTSKAKYGAKKHPCSYYFTAKTIWRISC